MTGQLLTARELATILGVSTETVLRWTRRRELTGFRLPGGAIRYREAEVEEWPEKRATTARGSATHPAAGRRPAATLPSATHPDDREEV